MFYFASDFVRYRRATMAWQPSRTADRSPDHTTDHSLPQYGKVAFCTIQSDPLAFTTASRLSGISKEKDPWQYLKAECKRIQTLAHVECLKTELLPRIPDQWDSQIPTRFREKRSIVYKRG